MHALASTRLGDGHVPTRCKLEIYEKDYLTVTAFGSDDSLNDRTRFEVESKTFYVCFLLFLASDQPDQHITFG